MTRDHQVELIQKKCVEANPYLLESKHGGEIDVHDPRAKETQLSRPLRLSDVLAAHKKKWESKPQTSENKVQTAREVLAIVQKWDLRKDNIIEQSDEGVALIADLLKA